MTSYPAKRYLLDIGTAQLVDADISNQVLPSDIADWQTNWQPTIKQLVAHLRASGVPAQLWPQSHHWDWAGKMSQPLSPLQNAYAVHCNGALQGLMCVRSVVGGCQIQSQVRKDNVYVDYLETAPWNQAQYSASPQYALVGTVLIVAALHLSIDQGCKGRIGLHSLPQSDTWYSNHLGMTDLGIDPYRYHGKLKYFETTPQAAKNILNGVVFP